MKVLQLSVVLVLMAVVSCNTRAWYTSRIINLKTQITNCTGKFVCSLDSTPGGSELCTMECVDKDEVCDGDDDCSGGQDEMNCPTAPTTPECICQPEEYLCRDNTTCIHRSRLCDGNMNDCPDDDDEENCPTTAPLGSFICQNGTAIPIASYCDGTVDCGGGEDEIHATQRCQCDTPTDASHCLLDSDDWATQPVVIATQEEATYDDCLRACCAHPDCDGFVISDDIDVQCVLYETNDGSTLTAFVENVVGTTVCQASFFQIN